MSPFPTMSPLRAMAWVRVINEWLYNGQPARRSRGGRPLLRRARGDVGSPMNPFRRFLECVMTGGHDFTKSTTCSRCRAEKGGPTLLSLAAEALAKASQPSAFCRSCWTARGRPSAALFLGREPKYACTVCGCTVSQREVVWVA